MASMNGHNMNGHISNGHVSEEHHRHSVSDQVERTQVRLPKKLIVCCDGTWMDRDNGYQKPSLLQKLRGKSGKLQNPSNVTRIARAMMSEDEAKHPQVIYYQSGIGTGIGVYDKLFGGGTGLGLSENVREAYAFLGTNYSPHDADNLSKPDSIFLLGFSRGAFTARTLGGFIAAVGILTKAAMPWFYDAFQDWEHAGEKDYQPNFFKAISAANPDWKVDPAVGAPDPSIAWSKKPGDIDKYMQQYKDHLLRHGLTQDANIKCIGVWDTVGALGIPVNPLLQRTLGMSAFIKEYRWYDTRLSNCVENAFHALALDERRFPFSPAVWEKDDSCKTNLKQAWFPGAHSNCGGSYEDYGMANITLAWMMDQVSGNSHDFSKKKFDPLDWIRFDDDYLDTCFKHNKQYYSALAQKNPSESEAYQGWSMGKVYDSNTFPQSLTGAKLRTPGRYQKTDYESGKYTGKPLENTCEYIHASVRARMDLAGRCVEPKEWYQKVLRWMWRVVTFQKGIKPYRPQRKKIAGGLVDLGGPLHGWRLIDGHESHLEPNMQIDMSPGGIKQVHWEYQLPGMTSASKMAEDIIAEKGYEQRLLDHDQDSAKANKILFSNNKWSWFKKPKKEHHWSKTF
ncbi:hypothetical protein HII31_09617 [Pseudocercospora fuligena]|uniref:T6SS Phospholipase effector Tle1-like catalytic domain-containing protein n=1 Tax=Pseudocercospora fuligena TaxID=685502 RepID=A0A8H6RC87_9PEZI|nr:hypothetical protein HII31_09617 [Pseudocercospora fuligena]